MVSMFIFAFENLGIVRSHVNVPTTNHHHHQPPTMYHHTCRTPPITCDLSTNYKITISYRIPPNNTEKQYLKNQKKRIRTKTEEYQNYKEDWINEKKYS